MTGKSIRAGHEIVWPGKVSAVPSDRATLSGVTLRIGLVESRPFTRIDYIIDKEGRNLTKFVGYIPDLIDLLKDRMNFIPQLFLAPTNQTYTGLVKSVARGDFDIVMGDVTMTSRRRDIAAFSASIFDNALRLIIRKPVAEQVDFFSYLRPFSPSLWVAIFITTIYASFLICLLERHDNEALRDRSILSMAAMAIWYSIGNIMGYGADFHVTTASGRLLTVALYILSLVLVASYTANLVFESDHLQDEVHHQWHRRHQTRQVGVQSYRHPCWHSIRRILSEGNFWWKSKLLSTEVETRTVRQTAEWRYRCVIRGHWCCRIHDEQHLL